ncbi:MAG: DUF2784 domain-containing protein [Calditrichia bacterium]
MHSFIANLILFFHLLYVLYIIAGFFFIWTGYLFGWNAIRNPLFRWSHLAAMGIVILETIAGVFCPLTDWEIRLRQAAGESFNYPSGFIPYWLHRLLFFDWPQYVFQIAYLGFFLLMILTFIIIPPRRKSRR